LANLVQFKRKLIFLSRGLESMGPMPLSLSTKLLLLLPKIKSCYHQMVLPCWRLLTVTRC